MQSRKEENAKKISRKKTQKTSKQSHKRNNEESESESVVTNQNYSKNVRGARKGNQEELQMQIEAWSNGGGGKCGRLGHGKGRHEKKGGHGHKGSLESLG